MTGKTISKIIAKILPQPKQKTQPREVKHKVNEAMMDHQWKKHLGGG